MHGLDGEISCPGWSGLDIDQMVEIQFLRPMMSQLEACVISIVKFFCSWFYVCKCYDMFGKKFSQVRTVDSL